MVLFATFVCLGLLEISLRLYTIINPGFTIPTDMTYLKYRGRPHSEEFNGFKLNSGGYKDTEFIKNKLPGRFRILSLGDSQTYGAVPYPDSYMAIVKNKLLAVFPHCEMYNMGVPSAGPVDYLSVLINEGFDLNPDMVLINFNIYDDFKNGGKRFKIYSYSAAASLINYILTSIFGPEGQVFGAGRYREGCALRSDESYVHLVIDAHGAVFQKNNVSFPRDFRCSVRFIKQIQKACIRKNIVLAVVIIPADLQLYTRLQKKVRSVQRGKEDDYDYRRPNIMLAGELQRLGIPCLDLLDPFLRIHARNGKDLTQSNDPHWNIYGSAVAADAVSPWLIQQVGHHVRLKNQN